MTITCPIACATCATCPIACFQYYKRSRGATGILLKNKMKSTLLFTLIGLLSIMAANPSPLGAKPCTSATRCDSGQYCYTEGVCNFKKLGGQTADKTDWCVTGILKNGKCGCSSQTGDKGCYSNNDYCDISNNKCVPEKKKGETCTENFECLTGKCYQKICVTPILTLPEGSICDGHQNCNSGLFCNSNKKCQKKKKLGDTCQKDYECKSNGCCGSAITGSIKKCRSSC